MKSLIRNPGETVLSTTSIDGIDWTTGAPLTNPAWAGGPYALCNDCPYTDVEPSDFDIEEVELPQGDLPDEEPTTVTRLIAVFNQSKYDARKSAEEE